MATDPAIVAQLSADLENLNKVIDDLSKEIQTNLNKNLAVTSENLQSLVTDFEKGNNITKKLSTNISKAQIENRKLGLDQNRFQAQLLEVEKKLQKSYNVKLEKEKILLKNKIQENLYQQQLNEQVLDYLRKLDAENEAQQKITKEKKKQNDLTEQAKALLKDTFKPLLELFTIAGIFKTIVNGALLLNKTSVDIGKNFGYGADQANRVANGLKDIAQSTTNVNITLKNLGEAMNDLSTSTGYVAEYSKDALETQVMLTKQLGLTGEEAAGFYKYSVLTGKTSKETYNTIKNSIVAMRNQLGVGIPFKATMAEVSKTSASIAASLGFNPERIAKAVVQAKALGTTLEQTKAQSESLLDFESSIDNELKAELLTGQSLNLERARALALQNDLAGVAEELANQGMTAAKFGQMNAIAQKSYAAALGLSTEQLSEQLQKRELAVASGKSLAQLDAEQADEAAKRQSIQDKFNAGIEKLQDLFGNLLAGPLGGFLELLTNSLDALTAIAAVMGTIFLLQKASAIWEGLSTALTLRKEIAEEGYAAWLGVSNGLLSEGLALQVANAAAWVIANPFLALGGLALAAGVGALVHSQMTKGDDVTSMGGYGNRTLLHPEGAIALNNNDTVIAGTNLGGKGGGGGNDNKELIAAISDLHSTMKESVSKPSVAYIQGARPFANVLGNQSQLFTAGMQNQSKLA